MITTSGQCRQTFFDIKGDDDVVYSVPGSAGLSPKMAKVAIGSRVWITYIDDRDVWAVGPRQSDGLPTLGGFSDHLDIALPVDHSADPGAYEVMVLDQHHTDGAALNRHGYPPAEVWRRLRCP